MLKMVFGKVLSDFDAAEVKKVSNFVKICLRREGF